MNGNGQQMRIGKPARPAWAASFAIGLFALLAALLIAGATGMALPHAAYAEDAADSASTAAADAASPDAGGSSNAAEGTPASTDGSAEAEEPSLADADSASAESPSPTNASEEPGGDQTNVNNLEEDNDDDDDGNNNGDAQDDGDEQTKTTTKDNENLLDPTQRADNSFIYDTTIEALFDQASLYEGNTVQIVGEVIGDLILASGEPGSGKEMYWIELTSMDVENSSSISVLLNAEQAKQIDHFGRYGVTGTTLQVRGTYHQACSEHQGLPDVHATNSSPIARGVEHPDKLRMRKFAPGLGMIFIGAILMGIYYFVRERSR